LPYRQPGFTLVELLVVVAVVAILAGIAYPNYVKQVQKSRRVDAQGALLQMANALERWHTLHNSSYANSTAAGGTTAGKPVAAICPTALDSADSNNCNWPNGGGAKMYVLSITALTATSYTLQAAPLAGTAQANDYCGALTLTSTGVKSAMKTGCW
jgi:type IV pilus assembly protein PilE